MISLLCSSVLEQLNRLLGGGYGGERQPKAVGGRSEASKWAHNEHEIQF